MKIRLLIDFNSFTEELAKLFNGNVPSGIGAPLPPPPALSLAPASFLCGLANSGALAGTPTCSSASRDHMPPNFI